jgi:hypothetical protein
MWITDYTKKFVGNYNVSFINRGQLSLNKVNYIILNLKKDDPPEKFYIILKGAVNIYLLKD